MHKRSSSKIWLKIYFIKEPFMDFKNVCTKITVPLNSIFFFCEPFKSFHITLPSGGNNLINIVGLMVTVLGWRIRCPYSSSVSDINLLLKFSHQIWTCNMKQLEPGFL